MSGIKEDSIWKQIGKKKWYVPPPPIVPGRPPTAQELSKFLMPKNRTAVTAREPRSARKSFSFVEKATLIQNILDHLEKHSPKVLQEQCDAAKIESLPMFDNSQGRHCAGHALFGGMFKLPSFIQCFFTDAIPLLLKYQTQASDTSDSDVVALDYAISKLDFLLLDAVFRYQCAVSSPGASALRQHRLDFKDTIDTLYSMEKSSRSIFSGQKNVDYIRDARNPDAFKDAADLFSFVVGNSAILKTGSSFENFFHFSLDVQ